MIKNLTKKLVAAGVTACLSCASFTVAYGAAAPKTITIGLNYELSGPVQAYGEYSVDGIMLAVDEVNKAGGINGKKIVVKKDDNKSDAQEAASITKKLIFNDKVAAIIGPATSGNAKAAREVANQNKVPLITGSATIDDLTVDKNGKVMPYIFRTCYKDSFQGHAMAVYVSKTLKLKNVAVLSDSTSDYSKGLSKYFDDTFKKNGGTIVDEENFNSADKDFKAVLIKLKAKNPQGIYLPCYYEAASLMIKQARQLGIKATFFGGDGYDDPGMVKLAGASNLKNVYYTNHYAPDSKEAVVVKFRQDFKKKYGKEPNAFNALAYDAAKLLFTAMKKAGSTDGTKIKTALEQTQSFKAVTGTFSIDNLHNTVKATVILKKDGSKDIYQDTVQP